ncbi:unnamed protein product [Polarella glacialis]|uniref:Nucleotide-diphospho-sugar transferase domain-containing protein n=1 Tax=Polarella glacialis TaxID=89957 RepID=A0A813KKI9_POLGL|nr:unnamed protein product [Polarella glacialis]
MARDVQYDMVRLEGWVFISPQSTLCVAAAPVSRPLEGQVTCGDIDARNEQEPGRPPGDEMLLAAAQGLLLLQDFVAQLVTPFSAQKTQEVEGYFNLALEALLSADKPKSQGADGGSAASESEAEAEAESVPKEQLRGRQGLGQEGGRGPEELFGMRPESCNRGRSQGDDQLQAKPEPIGKLLATCARDNTVVVTSASASYGQALLQLARSAAVQGFPCAVAYIQEDFQEACHAHVLPVRLSAELLPETQFCGDSSVEVIQGETVKLRQRWGWRRTQLYKVMAYRSVLKQGFDVLLMDTDWYFIADPLPFFHSLFDASAGQSIDVVGKKDDHYMNFGLSWTRSSAATVAMAASLEKRIGDGWDQYLWNHEMQTMDISCCNVHSLYLRFFQLDQEVHDQWVNEPADADSKKRCEPGKFDAKGWIYATRLPSLCNSHTFAPAGRCATVRGSRQGM